MAVQLHLMAESCITVLGPRASLVTFEYSFYCSNTCIKF